MTLFENKKIRCLRVANTNKYYFSVVDICAAIRDTDYNTARNYWKWLKNKLAKTNKPSASIEQPVSVTNQLKLPAADGKLRYTDVMDVEGILKLIQQFPGPKAVKLRLWLLTQVQAGKNLAKQLTRNLVDKTFSQEIKNAVKTALGAVVMLKTVRRQEFMLQ